MLMRIFLAAMMMIGLVNANAEGIQDAILKKAAMLAVKQAYSSLGLPDQDIQKALIDLQSSVAANTIQLNSLQLNLSEIDEKLSRQKVLEYMVEVQNGASDVTRWKNDNLTPTPAEIDRLVSSLGKAVLNLDLALNDGKAGLIPAMMTSKMYPRLSDLHDYWSDIDNMRYLLSPTFAQAVVAMATLREMTDRNFNAEQQSGGCTTRASNSPVPTSTATPVTSYVAVTTSGGA